MSTASRRRPKKSGCTTFSGGRCGCCRRRARSPFSTARTTRKCSSCACIRSFWTSQPLADESREKGLDHVWQSRYDDINAFEKTLAKENTLVAEVLFERLARRAAKAILGAARRPGEELEVLARAI